MSNEVMQIERVVSISGAHSFLAILCQPTPQVPQVLSGLAFQQHDLLDLSLFLKRPPHLVSRIPSGCFHCLVATQQHTWLSLPYLYPGPCLVLALQVICFSL